MFDMQTWSQEFISKAHTPMNDQINQLFTQMKIAESKNKCTIEYIKDHFIYQIIEKRAKEIDLELTNSVKAFIMFLAGSPANAVMYLYAIKSQTNKINMQNLVDLFPLGYLNKLELDQMWKKQKGDMCGEKIENCLDGYQFVE